MSRQKRPACKGYVASLLFTLHTECIDPPYKAVDGQILIVLYKKKPQAGGVRQAGVLEEHKSCIFEQEIPPS